MQTDLAAFIRDTPQGREADAILRRCVHCGFCAATCPTYQLLGDELDGPRGRIYLIKQMLEGNPVSRITQRHLDRCLTCRACETTCPSGVKYHRLLDIGREVLEQRVPRRSKERMLRFILAQTVPRRRLFAAALGIARGLRPLLPPVLAGKLPPAAGKANVRPRVGRHRRRMLLLAGCVQPTLAANTNAATARVFDRLAIELIEAPGAGCCGALRHHLQGRPVALDDMRRLIDVWWPYVEQGIEAIVITASGCGAQVRQFGELLQDDARYAAKASRIAALTRDVSEVLTAEQDALLPLLRRCTASAAQTIAFHAPCTLQHAQKINGLVESLLAAAGYRLSSVADAHLCCGSAGTYSLLQPALAKRLRDNKLAALLADKAGVVATANVGCQTHLQSGCQQPVRHWIELIDERLQELSSD
ncbi:MAG TPA: glycolate oxidase subunit GlcF [Accumulibacter sp.]|nr:glycolate oxidase subunit GlcF [Accumulibacter sp.]